MGQVWQAGDAVKKGLIVDKDMLEMSIAPVCLAPGKTSTAHSHSLVEEISIFKSGQGQIQIEDEFFDVCPGSISVVPAGQFHAVCNTWDENLEYTVVFNSNVDKDAVVLKSREQHFGLKERTGYLDLLSKISAGETASAKAFKCWTETTDIPELAKVLTVITLREAEHSASFEKRLCELGHSVDFDDVDEFACELFGFLGSDASDLDKLQRFHDLGDTNPFTDIFADRNIDPVSGALLGRYVAEEHDSIRLLQKCYGELCGAEMNGAAPTASGVTLDQVCEAVTSLTGLVSELKAEVAALKEPAKAKPAQKKRSSRSRTAS